MLQGIKVRPIVLIGNGPSIGGFNWDGLRGVDTMAMNAFNKVCLSSGWFPRYYCLFRKLDDVWGDEQERFIVENAEKCNRVFYINTVFGGDRVFGSRFDGIANCIGVDKIEMGRPPLRRYGGVKWAEPIGELVEKARAVLVKKVGVERANEIVGDSELPEDELTVSGLVKWFLHGEDAEYCKRDFSMAMRWNPSFMRPKSFSEFYAGPGDSSTDCARVASLLGYNLILLVGFDGRISVSESGVVDPSSWGIPGVFNGRELNLGGLVECPVCRTTEGLDEKRMELWDCFRFSEVLARNPVVVWNCTKGSALTNVEYHDLDETLDMIRSWK